MKKLAMLLALAVVVVAFGLSVTMGVSAAGDKVRGDNAAPTEEEIPYQNWEDLGDDMNGDPWQG